MRRSCRSRWLQPHFADERGRLKMSIHALVVEAPSRRIIVDTCLGNDKEGRRIPTWNNLQGPFLADLAAAGFPRESIDTVLCTHLHVDHVGWNTMLVDGKWVPTFPKARYLMGRVEFAPLARATRARGHGGGVRQLGGAGPRGRPRRPGRDRPPGMRRDQPDPDRRPYAGACQRRIKSQGEEALITGDFMHHPCQIARPHWCSTADSDPANAQATRERMLAELSSRPVLVIGTHFAGATAGRIVRDGDAYRMECLTDERTHFRRAQGHRLRQLYRRAGGGDGDVGFRRRGGQDRAAGHGRPVSPPRGAAAGQAAAQSRLFLRRAQQEEPGARSAHRCGARGAPPARPRAPTSSSPTTRRRRAGGSASLRGSEAISTSG